MTKHSSQSERRLYPRIPVNLLGELRIGGRDSFTCCIRDICQDGLLLECTESDHTQTPQDNKALLKFELPSINGSDLIQAWIQLLPRSDGFFGARFLHLNAQETTKLQSFIHAPRSTTANAISGGLAQTARTILRRITLRCLDDLTKPLLEQIKTTLSVVSERANNNVELTNINSDITRLDVAMKQRRFQEQLRRELLVNLVQIEKINSIDKYDEKTKSNNLTLIDQEGFELWLAVSALIENLEHRLKEDLLPLHTLSVNAI